MKKIALLSILFFVQCTTHISPETYMGKYEDNAKPIVIQKSIKDAFNAMYAQCHKCFNDGGTSDGIRESTYEVSADTTDKEKPMIKVSRVRTTYGSFGSKSVENDFVAILKFESTGKNTTTMFPYYRYKQMRNALEKWSAGTSEGCPSLP